MKIVYLVPGNSISGGVAVICQHANRLLRRGHEIVLVTETLETNLDWFPGQKVPVLRLSEYPDGVDVLVATGWSTSFTAAKLPAASKFYFVQSDETRFHPHGSDLQQITALSYCLNFNYLTEARWIQNWLYDNFGQKSELIPNGLDQEIFYPDQPILPKGKRPRILLEGAIDLPYKGMADAFASVQNIDAEIWCVSSIGRPKPDWRCDRFFNQVPMAQMRRIYSSCDVLLKLSRVEGFFGPPMEMMACGGAVVVGNVSGYDEYIVDGHNALVVELDNIDAANKAVEKIISDEHLKKNLIANGFATVNSWQWEPSIDRLETYFSSVLYGEGGRPLTPIRGMVDSAISKSYTLLKKEMDQVESAFPVIEPIDLILRRIRKISWVRSLGEILFQLYIRLRSVLR